MTVQPGSLDWQFVTRPRDLLAGTVGVQDVRGKPRPARRIVGRPGVQHVGAELREACAAFLGMRLRSRPPRDVGQLRLCFADHVQQAADLGSRRILTGPLRQPQFDQTTEPLTFARSQIA